MIEPDPEPEPFASRPRFPCGVYGLTSNEGGDDLRRRYASGLRFMVESLDRTRYFFAELPRVEAFVRAHGFYDVPADELSELRLNAGIPFNPPAEGEPPA